MDRLEQRRAALVAANDVRMRRVALKRDLRAGRVTLPDLLAGPTPDWLRNARLYDVMRGLPRMGHTSASWALHRASVPAGTTFAMLSDGQRRRLVAEVAKAPRHGRTPGSDGR